MITDYDIPSAISKIFQVNEVKRQFMNIYFHAKVRRSLFSHIQVKSLHLMDKTFFTG
ncbi:hypothetical protein [uncultured Nostoc sp.]|uniref:hypothetical protein n=1 Tax=uncultured Nostoc sp. TaxID=340711 RepID=UPI0035C95AC8